jgi:hypothetical protein
MLSPVIARSAIAIVWRPKPRVGYDYAHAIVDDHARLAYVELLDDEKAATATAFADRALIWFARPGIAARQLMTDNAANTYTLPTRASEARYPNIVASIHYQRIRCPRAAASWAPPAPSC